MLKPAKSKEYGKKSIFDYINVFILGLLTFIMIFPFYYVFIISFADMVEMNKVNLYLLPLSFDFNSYKVIFYDDKIVSGFLVSIFNTTIGTAFNMLMTVSAAYALSKKTLPFRRVFMTGIIFTMFFWGQLIPYYITIKNLGFVNNILVMIIPAGINTFYLIIIKNYFQTIPESLEESAKIDGANEIYTLIKIILPTSAPVMATFILFYAVERWNEWWLAMLFISKPNIRPLQIILREIVSNLSMVTSPVGSMIAREERPISLQSVRMAMVVVVTLPILLVYPFLQKHFTKGIMVGSIKG